MSITAYVGLPGHGKSYGVVANVIAPSLKSKRRVFTNIPMVAEECFSRFGLTAEQFDISDIVDDPTWWSQPDVAGAVVVLDEVWRLWPAGAKANQVREEDKAFLAEHRHMVGDNGHSTEIVLVTQDLGQIASFARALVETTFRVTKLSKIGADKTFRVDVYSGSVTGPNPPMSKREREIPGRFKPDIYSLYKSHTKSDVGAGNEARTDTRYNALGRISIKLGAVAFIALVFLVWKGSGSLMNSFGSGNPEVVEAETEKPDPAHAPAESSPTVKVNQPPPRPKYKFLSNAKFLIVVWNNGHYPDIDYRYRIVFDDYEAVFNTAELARLEYKVQPINECVVRITGADYDGFAMCPRYQEKRSFIQSVVTPSAVDAS